MKLLIAFAALLAVALSAPVENVEVISYQNSRTADSYHFDIETSDGHIHEEGGTLQDVGSEHPFFLVHGAFSWKDPVDGKIYTVTYIADENGYQPTGNHLPALPKTY